MKVQLLIDPIEFQKYILNFIGSKDFDKIWNNMDFINNSECKNAFIIGLAWASMLTSQVKNYEVMTEDE